MAGVRAHRGTLATPDFWSLHPFALWETLAPHLFGNYYDAFLADLPWMGALNFGRDPFFYSLYVGPLVLLLACAGLAARFRRNAFWLAILLVFLVAALGGYTPLYPLAAPSRAAADVFPLPGEIHRRQPVRLRGAGGGRIATLLPQSTHVPAEAEATDSERAGGRLVAIAGGDRRQRACWSRWRSC